MNIFAKALAEATNENAQISALSTNKLRQLCREGNPFPLIARQWPELVVTDPRDLKYFEGDHKDELNPVLRLDSWQRDILKSAFDPTIGEIFIKGCTGAGKGASMGLLACLLFDVWDPIRINITSDSFANAIDNLFGEIKKWRNRMTDPIPANVSSRRIQIHERRYIRVHNPAKHGKGESFSGAHSEGKTVYFFDEASAIPEVHYTNCLKNAKLIIAASNPRITEGWFRDGYKPLRKGDTKQEMDDNENRTGRCVGRLRKRLAVTVPGSDCTNVKYGRLKDPVAPIEGITIEGTRYEPTDEISPEHYEFVKALVPGQIDLTQYQSILHTSKESWEVECYAHARFPSEDPVKQVILGSYLPRHFAAHKAEADRIRVTCFGLDVGRSLSGDPTVLSCGGVRGCHRQHCWNADSNNEHVDRIISLAAAGYNIDLKRGENPICIDMGGGYGAGVADALRRLGVWVIDFVPQGRPIQYADIYANQRAEGYMMLSQRLDPNGNWSGMPYCIPEDADLEAELITPLKRMVRGGTVVQIEDKSEIQKRLGRSPDKADSLVCLFRAVFQKFQLHSMFQRPVKLMVGTVSEVSSQTDEMTSGDKEELVEVTTNNEDNRTNFMTEDPPEPSKRFMTALSDVVGMLDQRTAAIEAEKKNPRIPVVTAEERELKEMEERRARKLRRYLED